MRAFQIQNFQQMIFINSARFIPKLFNPVVYLVNWVTYDARAMIILERIYSQLIQYDHFMWANHRNFFLWRPKNKHRIFFHTFYPIKFYIFVANIQENNCKKKMLSPARGICAGFLEFVSAAAAF